MTLILREKSYQRTARAHNTAAAVKISVTPTCGSCLRVKAFELAFVRVDLCALFWFHIFMSQKSDRLHLQRHGGGMEKSPCVKVAQTIHPLTGTTYPLCFL